MALSSIFQVCDNWLAKCLRKHLSWNTIKVASSTRHAAAGKRSESRLMARVCQSTTSSRPAIRKTGPGLDRKNA